MYCLMVSLIGEGGHLHRGDSAIFRLILAMGKYVLFDSLSLNHILWAAVAEIPIKHLIFLSISSKAYFLRQKAILTSLLGQ